MQEENNHKYDMKKVFKSIFKDNIQISFSWISFIAGISLSLFGVFTEPVGVIDNSILVAIGEFLAFSGALVGLHTKYSADIEKIKEKLSEIE